MDEAANETTVGTVPTQHDAATSAATPTDNDAAVLESIAVKKRDEARSETKRHDEAAREFERQAAQLRVESRKLLQQAERIDEECRKARFNSSVSRTRSESLKFETMLFCLRRNDTETTVVDSNDRELGRFPHGYGKVLGEALLRNTSVTSLDLNEGGLLSSNLIPEAKARLELEALLQYLHQNSSLLRFGGHGGCCISQVLKKIAPTLLQGIATCTRLEQLTWSLPVCPSTFHTLLTSTRTLQTLDISFMDADAHAIRRIASAFESSTGTLKSLKLHVIANLDLTAAILASLCQMTSLLQLHWTHFSTHNEDTCMDALSDYLGSTRTLQRFTLENFTLNAAHMTRLISGLRHVNGNDGLPTTFLTALSFFRCDFEGNALRRLFTFLRTRTTGINGETVYHSNLRKLSIDRSYGNELGRKASRRLANALCMSREEGANDSLASSGPLGQQSSALVPTIGSLIQTLSLDRVECDFLQQLHRRAGVDAGRRLRLQCLELDFITMFATATLFRCLPKLSSLRKLKIACVAQPSMDCILQGLKNNGSIREVITTNDKGKSCFNEAQLRLIDAYCQRNQQLGDLIVAPPPIVEGDLCITGTSTTGDKVNLVRPSLLVLTKQIPISHSAMMSSGLLSLRQGIGTDSDYTVGEPECNPPQVSC